VRAKAGGQPALHHESAELHFRGKRAVECSGCSRRGLREVATYRRQRQASLSALSN
jgi:hypothetical protein